MCDGRFEQACITETTETEGMNSDSCYNLFLNEVGLEVGNHSTACQNIIQTNGKNPGKDAITRRCKKDVWKYYQALCYGSPADINIIPLMTTTSVSGEKLEVTSASMSTKTWVYEDFSDGEADADEADASGHRFAVFSVTFNKPIAMSIRLQGRHERESANRLQPLQIPPYIYLSYETLSGLDCSQQPVSNLTDDALMFLANQIHGHDIVFRCGEFNQGIAASDVSLPVCSAARCKPYEHSNAVLLHCACGRSTDMF